MSRGLVHRKGGNISKRIHGSSWRATTRLTGRPTRRVLSLRTISESMSFMHSNLVESVHRANITIFRQARNNGIWAIRVIKLLPRSIQVLRILLETSMFQLSRRIELPQTFPLSPQTFSSKLIVIVRNVANTIDFIHDGLLLQTIFLDKMLEQLLGAKRNFHVIDWLDEFLLNISFVYILTRANIFCKWIVGSRGNFKHRTHWWGEKLRMAGFRKRFAPREIADGH